MLTIFYLIAAENKETNKMNSTEQSNKVLGLITRPTEAIKRLIFGIHSKTKRTLAEEAESGDELSVSSWIRDGADPNERDAYGYTPLLNASANGRYKAVKNLIKNGADVNMRGPYGFTALHAAAQKGHQEIVACLIKNGADINAQNDDMDTPLHFALREQHLEVVNVLIKYGCNARIEGFNNVTAIQCAKECGLSDLADLLQYNVN